VHSQDVSRRCRLSAGTDWDVIVFLREHPDDGATMTVHWFLLWTAILTSVFAQTLLKAGASGESAAQGFLSQVLDLRTITGLALYGFAALLYTAALRRIPLSFALPCTASSYVAAVVVGHVVFSESITVGHWMAMVVIACGVILLALATR
jgi:small multidrug resistance pump